MTMLEVSGTVFYGKILAFAIILYRYWNLGTFKILDKNKMQMPTYSVGTSYLL